jgi:DNA-binding transcriptional MerR regulator
MRVLHLDKAPDAFRTISEVADDLDIPQHVLRFWETRFTQIKPMKRSGGRRDYRPDDVDLLRGIRRLLYGEGYTIRGVQRILKENGIKAVQGLVDGTAAPAFAAEATPKRRAVVDEEDDDAPDVGAAADAEDDDDDVKEDAARVVIRREPAQEPPRREPEMSRREPEMFAPLPRMDAPRPVPAPSGGRPVETPPPASRDAPRLDIAQLETVLKDLLACRQLLDTALKDG